MALRLILEEPTKDALVVRVRGTIDLTTIDQWEELMRRVNARRRVFLSGTEIGGRFVLRICVLSFRTHRDRVQDAVTAIREEIRGL